MQLFRFLTGLTGMGITFLTIPLILWVNRGRNLAQRGSDHHHTHTSAVPRLGGLALVAGFLGAELLISIYKPASGDARVRWVILGSSLGMFGLGLWDDFRPLGAKKKLLGQVIIALLVCSFGIGIQHVTIPFSNRIVDLNAWGVLLTVIWLVGMTNLVNLIDGVDGLAAGIGLMLMALLAYVGRDNANLEYAAPGMVGALLGFLWFNFPPARIYLGDGGAYFLGCQVGIFSLVSSHKGTVAVALIAPLFVLALPILDMSLAIARRGLRGLPIFRADRKHLHHRLLNMGLSRQKVVLAFYAVTLVFLIMGFAAFSSARLVPMLAGLAGLILLLCAGKLSFSREWFAVGRALQNSLRVREEVQSALCLTRWLALEGKRQPCIETMWENLIFVASRLGFTSVSLRLEDGNRTWSVPHGASNQVERHFSRHNLAGGRLGVLELAAPLGCPDTPDTKSANGGPEPEAKGDFRSSQLKLFEILSELVAEAWLKAAATWQKENGAPVSFSAREMTSEPCLNAS